MKTKSFLDHPQLFVTGTDTGIGKTVLSAAIATLWRDAGEEVCAVKAIAAGGHRDMAGNFLSEDSLALAVASTEKGRDLFEAVTGKPLTSPVAGYTRPMAPYTASLLDGEEIDLKALTGQLVKVMKECAKKRVRLLIEGAGGVHVPLSPSRTVADLIAELNLPAVVVARTELGTINHTLLTVEALRRRRIPIAAVILNRRRRGVYTETEKASIYEIGLFLPKRVPLLVSGHASAGRMPTLQTAEVIAAGKPGA